MLTDTQLFKTFMQSVSFNEQKVDDKILTLKKTNSKLSLDGSGNLKTQKIPKSTV